jgi:subtilisin family serine protease
VEQPKAEVTPEEEDEAPSGARGQADHACAPGVDLALGNTYATLACLPQLDQIGYWKAADTWAALDDVPVHVAILDLSFVTDHPDLARSVDFTWNFLDDGCGTVGPGQPRCRDVAPSVPQPPPPALLGEEQLKLVHGTMLAGLVAGRGEPGKGAVGVNPSAQLDLVVRDLDTDNLAALKYAAEQRFDVVSISWPLGSLNGEKDVPAARELIEQMTRQGTVVVAAAGNSAVDVDERPVYPTRYSTIPGVIAVGSVDPKGDLYAQFSNYGPEYVDLGAPGMAASSGGDFQGGRYSVQIGSSYSAPIVAGAASRVIQYLKSRDVPYTAADVEELLLEGSPTSAKLTPYFKEGRHLDMQALLAHLQAAHP